jgi:hypothetical protein
MNWLAFPNTHHMYDLWEFYAYNNKILYIYIYILHVFNFFKLNTIKFKAFLNNRSEWPWNTT